MKKIANGFQCETCRAIYQTEQKAEQCENIPLEKPEFHIGDVFIDDSYDAETEVRICCIYYQGHEVCYRMEWQDPDEVEWSEVYTLHSDQIMALKKKESPS